MIFKETSNKGFPTVILLHGGGLSDWSLQKVIESLQTEFHVVTPIIDGHGEDGGEPFISIEDSAAKLLHYIDTHCQRKVFAIGGLSIGAQIVTEVLSQRMEIADYAIIESALVYPIKGIGLMTVPTYQLFYGLVKQRWFSKMQAKALRIPSTMFEQYYKDSLNISKQSLINITLSNGSYDLKGGIEKNKARVLIIVGDKEIGIMKKSAKRLHDAIANSELYVAPKMGHGEISLAHWERYVELLKSLFAK